MKINTEKRTMELKEAIVNNTVYVSHQDLKTLAREEGVMFDFPYISAGDNASAMCVVSNMQGMRCYGTGQAQSLKHAVDLAFDNAMIDLYMVCARSSVELDIMKAAKTKAEQKKKAADEKVGEEAAARKAAQEAVARKAAEEAAAKKAAQEAAARKAAEEAAAKKAAEEAAVKKAAQEAAAKKAAQEAAARKAAEEAAAKKAAEEAAARKAAEEAAAKKAAQEAAAKKAAEEATARKAAEEQHTGYWYENESDWVGCHSLTPEDPDDTVINYGPFKQTGDPSELKPGPKYLSQVLKYRTDFIEKLVGIQPPAFIQRIPQILTYCKRHGIGLRATSSKAHDILAQYGVKEL